MRPRRRVFVDGVEEFVHQHRTTSRFYVQSDFIDRTVAPV